METQTQNQPPAIEPEWLTEQEVADYLRVEKRTARVYLADGHLKDLKRLKLGDANNSPVRYSRPDLEYWAHRTSTGLTSRYHLELSRNGERIKTWQIHENTLIPILDGWAELAPEPMRELSRLARKDSKALGPLRNFDNREYTSGQFTLRVWGV